MRRIKRVLMKKKKYGKWHIKPRILLMLLAMVIVVFLFVIVGFNFFIQNFIHSNVKSQLDTVVKAVKEMDVDTLGGAHKGNGANQEEKHEAGRYMPDLSKFSGSIIRTEAHIFNASYQYKVVDVEAESMQEEAEAIAAQMKEKEISLSSAQDVHLDALNREYYVSAIKDPLLPNVSMVFYIDVTDVMMLAKVMNGMLGIISLCAMLVCLFLANTIAGTVTAPVRQLSDFAEEIGKGNFSRRELHYEDIEFEELACVMNKTAEQLNTYDQDQKTFFQNVSHELRTPLMSIECYAEGIACGVMEPEKSGKIILQETARLTEMVEDLLFISRLDSHTLKVKMEEADLRETIAAAATMQQAIAEQKGIRIHYDFAEQEVRYCYSEDNMYRAMTNLISNALRYAHSEITLVCKVEEGQTQEKHICIEVRDDGDGISAEDQPHIFERFYKGKGGKNGIGLAIVKSAAELHGGSVETVPQKQGACFRILLPYSSVSDKR